MAKRKAASNAGSKKPAKRPIEQYSHPDKQRVNNPPVGLVTPSTGPPETAKKTYAYDPHLDPQLLWAGKAERTSFEVPTVSLHVHERIDPKTIIDAVKTSGNGQGTPRLIQQSLFDQLVKPQPELQFEPHEACGWHIDTEYVVDSAQEPPDCTWIRKGVQSRLDHCALLQVSTV